jgi:hypothetical protein
VLTRGSNWEEAIAASNVALAVVVRSIARMGLEVAPHKTEASFSFTMGLGGSHRGPTYSWAAPELRSGPRSDISGLSWMVSGGSNFILRS